MIRGYGDKEISDLDIHLLEQLEHSCEAPIILQRSKDRGSENFEELLSFG